MKHSAPIVLDTNVLIMSISMHSPYYAIWRKFLIGEYTLCITNDILEEYSEVLSRNISPYVSEAIINTILTRKNVKRVDPHFSFGLITQDPDDNKFVDCAIVSNANYIVTEDKHFNVLKEISFPKVSIRGIDTFLHTLEQDL